MKRLGCPVSLEHRRCVVQFGRLLVLSLLMPVALLSGAAQASPEDVGPDTVKLEAAGFHQVYDLSSVQIAGQGIIMLYLDQLAKKNEQAKGFDIAKILDPSFVQSAADRGLGK